jgi:hypothetical protein
MKRDSIAACLALLALCALPTSASAEFTVTIKNTTGTDTSILPAEHVCIHDPGYFKKDLPAGKTVKITAKWIDGCGLPGDKSEILFEMALDGNWLCAHVLQEDKYKNLEVRQEGSNGWLYMTLSDGTFIGNHDCYPNSPGHPTYLQ